MEDKYLINMIVCGNDDEQHKFPMKYIHLLVFPSLSLINNGYQKEEAFEDFLRALIL